MRATPTCATASPSTTTRITVRPDGSRSSQGTTMVKLGRQRALRRVPLARQRPRGPATPAPPTMCSCATCRRKTTLRVDVLASGSQDTVSAGTTGQGADISADGRKVLIRSAANPGRRRRNHRRLPLLPARPRRRRDPAGGRIGRRPGRRAVARRALRSLHHRDEQPGAEPADALRRPVRQHQ